MRVLVVTNDFPPRVGGVNSYVSELMRRFPPGEVTVFASDWPGAEAFDASYPHPVVRWSSRGMYPTAAVREQVEELTLELRPDILLFGAAAPLALMGRAAERRTGVPYATFTHGVEYWAGRMPVTRALLRSVTGGAALTLGVSRWAVDRLRAAVGPEPRIELLLPGVDRTRFHPGVSDAVVRERHGLGDHQVICCVARLVARKGQDTVIGALPLILRQAPEARFLVVGSGPDRGRLDRLARRHEVADRVIFTGEVADDVLPQYFRTGDVFAMPNRSRKLGLEVEAFGIAFIEAAAVGRPSVGGDSGGAPEAVLHGETGLVVDSTDVDEVAKAIVMLLGDPRAAAKIGAAGARRVHREFAWEGRSAQLRRLLVDALEGRRAVGTGVLVGPQPSGEAVGGET